MTTRIQPSKLSPEIISEIFKTFSTTVIIHRPQTFPWFLGQICSRWRGVFLSMSTHFWGDIAINVSRTKAPFPDSVAYLERARDIFNFCLKCNEGCPLSFIFFMSASHYADELAFIIDILDALIAQSMRWSNARFYSLPVREIQRLHRVKGRTPLLQSLVVVHAEDRQSLQTLKSYERFANAFEHSPSLKHLQLSHIATSKFPWSSVVSFQLQSLTESDTLVAALSQAKSLVELDIGSEDTFREPIDIDGTWGMITLPSLKKLTLRTHNILRALIAPRLENLSIHFLGRSEQLKATGIPIFIRQSPCPLKTLSLSYVGPAATEEALLHVPGLNNLQLRDHQDSAVVKLLNCNIPEGASLMTPRLKSLEIDILSFLDSSLDSLLTELSAMITSRAQNPAVDGLQKLSLKSTYEHGIDMTIFRMQCAQHHVELTVGPSSE